MAICPIVKHRTFPFRTKLPSSSKKAGHNVLKPRPLWIKILRMEPNVEDPTVSAHPL